MASLFSCPKILTLYLYLFRISGTKKVEEPSSRLSPPWLELSRITIKPFWIISTTGAPMLPQNRLISKWKSLEGYSGELEMLNFLVSTVQNLRLIWENTGFPLDPFSCWSQESNKIKRTLLKRSFYCLVEMTGLEPAASTSRTWRATNCATSRFRFARAKIIKVSIIITIFVKNFIV